MSIDTFLSDVLPAQDSTVRANTAQQAYASDIARALAGPVGRFDFIEGATGIGKTLAYLLAASDWLAQAGKTSRRVVISTYSRSLQRQVIDDTHRNYLRQYAAFCDRPTPRMAIRMGRSNYVSAVRLSEALGAPDLKSVWNDPKRPEVDRAIARWAATSDGCLLDLADVDLPARLTTDSICLESHDPMPDELAAQIAQAETADIVVINHALLVHDLLHSAGVIGRARDDLALIIDEGEHFPQVAEEALSKGISYRHIASVAQALCYKTHAKNWDRLVDTYANAGQAATTQSLDDEHRAAVSTALASVVRSRKVDPELSAEHAHWMAIRELAKEMAYRLDKGEDNVGVSRSPVYGLPTLVSGRANAACIIYTGMKERRTILTSATLSDLNSSPSKPKFMYMLSYLARRPDDERVGIMAQHEPLDFGQLDFLAAPAPCRPLAEDEGRYRLVDRYAAHAIPWALGGAGRTLVLCNSYSDVRKLAAHWPDRERGRLVTHEVGADLNAVASSMGPNGVLVTPAGWEGLSPRREGEPFWSRIVLLRNPTPPLSSVQEWLLAQRLQESTRKRRSMSAAKAAQKASKIMHSRASAVTAHRVRQGIGRAIRHPDDAAEIVILDPRFRTDGARSGNHLAGLAAAIPLRFQGQFEKTMTAPVAEEAEAIIL